ncbi:MAG: hypothetical protein IPO40_12110 [Fibrobacteres bacterium]|nr:hypothetical protein [Fibrobacterota bacterium]
MNRKSIWSAAMALALCSGVAHAQAPKLANVEHHWLANTGGRLDNHVANFLTDMVLYTWEQSPNDNPLLLTASFWDEGACGYCSYSTTRKGLQVGKAEWWRDTIHSDRAYSKDTKCEIKRFWGRNFLDHDGPPPVGDSAPYVTCSNGDTIRSVIDPTALAFDNAGNLLVADNGPDQNIKFFSLKPVKFLRTFGDSGGVFARSRPGAKNTYLPGQVDARRFWGIRGLAVDEKGILYVGNTGIPMQTMGGTNIRAFAPTPDSSLLWENHGLAFVNNADADPVSNGQDLYLNAKRFRMDYSKNPGDSWKFTAVTLDPFRFPKDARLTIPMASVWERRLEGKRFQYHTNMYGEFVYVVRFEDTSEIGIPTAFFNTYGDRTTGWGADSAPTWERNETNTRKRWYWVDRNGDGIAQKTEYGTYDNWNIYNQGFDVDEKGDIWMGGTGDTSTYFRAGGVARIRAGALNAKGVPAFDVGALERWSIPFKEGQGAAIRIKHMAAGDQLLLAEGASPYFSAGIHVYRNFTDLAKRQKVCRIDLGYDDKGKEVHLDQGTDVMTLPMSFTADSEYVYVGYLDNGRYSRQRCEATVYSATTCQPVGWMAPDSQYLGGFAGTIDIVNGLNVAVQADGHRVVMMEEDGAGKVLAYRWCPDGKPCASTSSSFAGKTAALLPWRAAPGRLDLRLGAGDRYEVRNLSGRLIQQGGNASTEANLQTVSVRRGGYLLRILGGTQNREWVVPVP